MSDADQNIFDLWVATFGEPPPVRCDVATMVRALVEGLQEPSREVGMPIVAGRPARSGP